MSDKKNTDKKQPKPQKKNRQKLFNTGKIVVAVLLVLLMLPAMGMVWVKDSQKSPSYCGNCHEDPYYTSWSDSSLHLLAEKHALAGVSCESCHDRSLGEAGMEVVNYVIGNYYSPLPAIEVTMEDCFACHEDYETVANRTSEEYTDMDRNPHAGHWGELECTTCHQMHRESIDYCAQCHGPTTDAEGWTK